jgi:anti-sigma regulatory factor (Ser/Thr protein kinase)
MWIEQTTRHGCAVVSVHGRLDLSGLLATAPCCAMVFTSVATHPSTSWPRTGLLLCAARPQVARVLDRLYLGRFLPIDPALQAALRHAVARPPCLREELVLASSTTAPAAARRFVREVCRSWRLREPDDASGGTWSDDLVDRAELLASELVTNAVLHAGARPAAGGELRLLVDLRGRRLRLAVHDAARRLLPLAPSRRPDLEAEGGRGLLLVDRLATAWGTYAAAGSGKVTWCILKP